MNLRKKIIEKKPNPNEVDFKGILKNYYSDEVLKSIGSNAYFDVFNLLTKIISEDEATVHIPIITEE